MDLRVLHLYRPRLPSTRAQSIQVLGSCHGLASRGCEVTVLADPPEQGARLEPEQILEWYGLSPVDGLDLRIAPARGGSARSMWFRSHAMEWMMASLGRGPHSVVLARSKRYVNEVLTLPLRPPVVLEAHEVDSLQSCGSEARAFHRLEQRVLQSVQGLVTNCAGTMKMLEKAHPDSLPTNTRVVHNATAEGRARVAAPPAGDERIAGYAGSLRSFKGLYTLLEAARRLPEGWVVELVGGSRAEREALGPLPDRVRDLGEVPYTRVPEIIARWRCAVISLEDNLFGRSLCNPLKLWDYLAVGVPVVAPELPTIREVLDDRSSWYLPGDASSLAEAIGRCPRRGVQRLRTWEHRADELLEVLTEAL